MRRQDLVQETFKSQGMQDAYYKNVYLPDFARDVVLYGRSDAEKVLASYDLTVNDFLEIQKLPLFMAEVGNLKKRLAESDNAVIQIKANELLDGVLHVMQSRLVSGNLKPKELVEMGKFLADLTGVKASAGKDGGLVGPVNTGTVVQVSYGSDLDRLHVLPADAPVNDTYKKIAGNYVQNGLVIEEGETS